MRTKTIEKVIKHSLVYGYAVTQPFLLHVDIQSQIEDQYFQKRRPYPMERTVKSLGIYNIN